ncbi:Uma2 family endonuclease [Pseudanabaena sp. PCC 6802]|uniref:Uma2 family endonuclease n=1 Tax=Pseudanabaena sp. PCC 6802 TaxID=118173 RepID=UPI00035CE387|nr:Uma2 family endonuclease [Pseudanabaena sp. PCC 6802]
MTVTKLKLTFDRFLEEYPDNGCKYELVGGEFVEMRATRGHDTIADLILFTLHDEVRRLNLDLVVTNRLVIQTLNRQGEEQARIPDVSVVDRQIWLANPSAYTAFNRPIQLAVEVTSTNWDDDYVDKLEEYEHLGIAEYWIVDYLAIAAREYLGNPKQPTVFVHVLGVDGKYQRTQFRGEERIVSKLFPELDLTVAQIIGAAP